MLKKIFLLALVTVLSFSLVFALTEDYKGKPITSERIIGPHSELPAPDGLGPAYEPYNPTDPIGDVFILGTTWYDIQHNGTCGRQIQIDNDNWVHVVWMNGLNFGASQRHIFYQLMDPNDVLQFPGGVQVDQLPRSGYTTMVLYPDNRAMPTFHQGQGGATNFHTGIAFDYFPRTGAFMTTELPWVYELGLDLEVIWPRSAIDANNRMHVVSTENPASGVAGDPQRHYYGWADFDPGTLTLTTCTAQEMMTWTMVIASDVGASPVSDRVAIGWMQMAATGDTNQYDNDLILCISEDGINWDWTDTINVTNWIPPDMSYYPDTTLMNRDTIRCYTDMCVMFDYNDVVHVFFSTRGFYSLQGTLTWGNGYIWHWDEDNGYFSMVANGWFSNGYYAPGAWNIYTQKPSASADEATGDLYCMYQRYMNPIGPGPQGFPYMIADTTDYSQAGFPNGEIWVTKSTDGGVSWAEGTNVTDTQSPGAGPGQCLSELTPCMAPQITDDNLHIFYIMDKDAGAVVQTEGTWTLNDVIYQRVPTSMIAEEPLLQAYPMHCDSTGMPPAPGLNVAVNLTPYNPPIVLPGSGGTFEFNIEVTNNEPSPSTFDVWTMATLPNGHEAGPLIGPVEVTVAAGATIDRDRNQAVPFTAPAGTYTYDAYVGEYPGNIWDEDHFDFQKLAVDNGEPIVTEWANWGESFGDLTGDAQALTPDKFALHPAYPNPFNPETNLTFDLPDAGNVSLVIYDISGREIVRLVDEWRQAGVYEITFDASGLSSGVYFARLQMGNSLNTQKLLLLK